MAVCVCVSVGRASVGSTVKQSDSQSGGLHSQTNERLPHSAAWRQQIHTGTVSSLPTCVNIMHFMCRARDKRIIVIFLFFSLSLSGTFENDSLKDQADSGWRRLPPTLPQNVCRTVLAWESTFLCTMKQWLKVCCYFLGGFLPSVFWRTRTAARTYSTKGSSGPAWR